MAEKQPMQPAESSIESLIESLTHAEKKVISVMQHPRVDESSTDEG